MGDKDVTLMVSVLIQLTMSMRPSPKVYKLLPSSLWVWIKSEANALAHISILEAWDLNDSNAIKNMMVQPLPWIITFVMQLWVHFMDQALH